MDEKETARKVEMATAYLQREFTTEELDALLAKIEREDTVMPLLHPSYWIDNQDNLTQLRRRTEAIRNVVKSVK